ncbi:hypothetical protein [Marinobacter orientalis]|uniref:Uncharacterized protein n=1 Tax=Marinobacter orientalis TaxID=1928859 RepID=A0A7Y0RAY2_9GAMM|nr:hypothetical protein [Marinobacter orientalis]NMT62792.1 hypothetical protein [Marinobacter orientalis]TGX51471.1 hypothetical protein DIT72_05455 [Marinobacter orientalis]
MRGSFEFEWWDVDRKGDSRAREVKPHHRATLERTASRVVADRLPDGPLEGKMYEVVSDTDNEGVDGVYYEGYWRVVAKD